MNEVQRNKIYSVEIIIKCNVLNYGIYSGVVVGVKNLAMPLYITLYNIKGTFCTANTSTDTNEICKYVHKTHEKLKIH